MRSYTLEGIVIKRSNLGESDKLITLFSLQEGKLTLVAKALRRAKSRRIGQLELFNHVRVNVVHSKSNLDILTQVQPISSFPHWKKYLGRITLAYQLCEAVDKLTADRQAHPTVFFLLLSYLSEISHLTSNWKPATDRVLGQLMAELGFWSPGQTFSGDPIAYIEELAQSRLNSPRLLSRLMLK